MIAATNGTRMSSPVAIDVMRGRLGSAGGLLGDAVDERDELDRLELSAD